MNAATQSTGELQKIRHYSLQFINERSGKVLRPDYFPMPHAQACHFKSKFTPHAGRRIELYEVSP